MCKCVNVFHELLTYFFGMRVAPEDNVAFEEVRNPHSLSFALGRHHCPYKAPVNICHHQISTVGKNELRKTT